MELTDDELEAVAAGKAGTPQFFGRVLSTRPTLYLFPRLWEYLAVARTVSK